MIETELTIQRNDLEWVTLAKRFIALSILCLVIRQFYNSTYLWPHAIFCVVGLFFSSAVMIRVFKSDINVILYDLRVIFLLSFNIYFLIGSSLLSFDSGSNILVALEGYFVGLGSALKADAINAMGFGIAILIITKYKPIILEKNIKKIAKIKIRPINSIILMILVGVTAKIYVFWFDIISNHSEYEYVSGLWRTIEQLSFVGVYILIVYRNNASLFWHIGIFIYVFLLSLIGITQFSKAQLLYPIALYVLGYSIKYKSLRILIPGFLIVYLLFSSIGGAFTYARSYIDENYTIEERIQIVNDGFSSAETNIAAEYSGWSRINYLNTQVAAFDFYDSGIGGNSFRLIPWTFVPRFLAPNKPSITDDGPEFGYKFSGHYGASMSPGIFVDGYYNMGWLGFLIGSIVIGLILAQFQSVSRVIYQTRSYFLYPFLFFGLGVAFRIDGSLVVDYVGTFSILFFSVTALSIICSFLYKNG